MKHWWQIFVLWVFGVLILWLTAPYLALTRESAPQEKWIYSLPWHCSYPWFKFGKCGCPSRTLNCSSRHHTVEEWNWFEAWHEKTIGYLMRTKVLWWLGMNSASELGKVWKKLLRVIPRPLVHHFDFYCGTCVVLGKPQLLQGSGLGDIHQRSLDFRMNQALDQGFEADAGNQTTGPLVCPRNASDQRSWRLQLPDLVWTSDSLSDKATFFGFGSKRQRKWSRYWENGNRTSGPQEIMSMQNTEAEKKAIHQPGVGQAHRPHMVTS